MCISFCFVLRCVVVVFVFVVRVVCFVCVVCVCCVVVCIAVRLMCVVWVLEFQLCYDLI